MGCERPFEPLLKSGLPGHVIIFRYFLTLWSQSGGFEAFTLQSDLARGAKSRFSGPAERLRRVRLDQ